MNHSERKHALLSASGANRWVNCPPSARMGDVEPDTASSVFAEEGTLAHELADLELKLLLLPNSHVGSKLLLLGEKQNLQNLDLYDPEMDEYVQEYVDYVWSEYQAASKRSSDAVLRIEERSDYSYLVPEGFGTSDANIISDGTLEIADLKYGKGIKVSAVNNAQLRLYALGLLRGYDLSYDIKEVKMTIVQPRLYHVDSEIMTVEALHQWAEEVIRPAAAKAYKGEGSCKVGDWCKWCKAKPKCRAMAQHNTDLARFDFQEPKHLTDAELIDVFEATDMLVDWAKSVEEYVKQQALEGKKWQGYKLVEGRSVRKWSDEKKAIQTLCESLDFNPVDITNVKIKGIGDVEKLVGKKELAALDLLIKPQGKPTLVPESDKRPELGIDQAKKDFSE